MSGERVGETAPTMQNAGDFDQFVRHFVDDDMLADAQGTRSRAKIIAGLTA
jgi:hypothetical protein